CPAQLIVLLSGSKGLRVMAFAYRLFDPDMVDQVRADPMAAVSDLTFSSLVGIIDPLRPSGQGSDRGGASRRYRRAHDHRRPCRHRPGHRRRSGTGARE
ncbi:MAG: hypothetical protein V9E98_06580, partial [Candidatus Nanopelagicales bacterium]